MTTTDTTPTSTTATSVTTTATCTGETTAAIPLHEPLQPHTLEVAEYDKNHDRNHITRTSSPVSSTTIRLRRDNIPSCLFHGQPEALAWCIDNCVTIVSFIGVGAFLGTALLTLASQAAGCDTSSSSCEEKIYGVLKPSSLLSTMKTIVDVVCASLMPWLGAVVDTTHHRRLFGRILASCFVAFLGVSISVSENTWFAIAILQILWGLVTWMYVMISYSYLPDLTTDKAIMNQYTKQFAACSYVSMVLYTAIVVGVTAALGLMSNNDEGDEQQEQDQIDNEVATARLAQSVSFALCMIGLPVAWGCLFGKRPPLRILTEQDQQLSLCWLGLIQLRNTIREIWNRHLRLKWFYISVMFSDPAIMALTILAITFLTDTLQFNAQQNGTAMLIMMLAAVPGAYLGAWITKRTNHNAVLSSMVALTILIVTTVLVAVFLDGPGKQTITYILAVGWGLGTGQKWASDRMVLLLVLPPGQNAELMGIYTFFRQVLSWLPPLVFTILNEEGVQQRYGMATLIVYFVLSFLACIQILRSKPDMGIVDASNGVDILEEGQENDYTEDVERGTVLKSKQEHFRSESPVRQREEVGDADEEKEVKTVVENDMCILIFGDQNGFCP